jgi:hypothetical protein
VHGAPFHATAGVLDWQETTYGNLSNSAASHNGPRRISAELHARICPGQEVDMVARGSYARARLACALTSSAANSLRASFGNAAAAIIAALSVDRPGDGKYTG